MKLRRTVAELKSRLTIEEEKDWLTFFTMEAEETEARQKKLEAESKARRHR